MSMVNDWFPREISPFHPNRDVVLLSCVKKVVGNGLESNITDVHTRFFFLWDVLLRFCFSLNFPSFPRALTTIEGLRKPMV